MNRTKLASAVPTPRPLVDLDDVLSEARHLLDGAYELERGLDFTAAVARARRAGQLVLGVPSAEAADLRDDIALAVEELGARHLVWRRSVEARKAIYDAREIASA